MLISIPQIAETSDGCRTTSSWCLFLCWSDVVPTSRSTLWCCSNVIVQPWPLSTLANHYWPQVTSHHGMKLKWVTLQMSVVVAFRCNIPWGDCDSSTQGQTFYRDQQARLVFSCRLWHGHPRSSGIFVKSTMYDVADFNATTRSCYYTSYPILERETNC